MAIPKFARYYKRICIGIRKRTDDLLNILYNCESPLLACSANAQSAI
jgi:hypothetical protein